MILMHLFGIKNNYNTAEDEFMYRNMKMPNFMSNTFYLQMEDFNFYPTCVTVDYGGQIPE